MHFKMFYIKNKMQIRYIFKTITVIFRITLMQVVYLSTISDIYIFMPLDTTGGK